MKLQDFAIIFILSLSYLSVSCKKETPQYQINSHSKVTPKRKEKKYHLNNKDITKLFKRFNDCRKEEYCKPKDILNNFFIENNRESNLKIFLKAANSNISRIQTYVVFKLFAFRERDEIVPVLQKIINETSDVKLKLLAVNLLLLNHSEDALNFVFAKWNSLPDTIRAGTLWTIRKINIFVPKKLIESMEEDKLPVVRTMALEMKVSESGNIQNIINCINENNSQSGFCALALVKFKNKHIPDMLSDVIKGYINKSKLTRRRLKISVKLIDALGILEAQGRISKSDSFELARNILGNTHFNDRFRAAAAYLIGKLGTRKGRLLLDKYRRNSRSRVAYAARRAIYFMEKKG